MRPGKRITVAAAAVAVLAVPIAARGDRPQDSGKPAGTGPEKGQGKAQGPRTTGAPPPGHAKRAAKAGAGKGVGYVVGGVLTEPGRIGLDARALGDELRLDLTSANHHAREALGVETGFIARTGGAGTKEVGAAGDEVLLRYVGYDDGEAPAAGDRVKVIGKIARTRDGGAWTYADEPDIRKVMVFGVP